tara:strand:+ start:199 stop:372 length:174 start_codon:yes stop_codon:yes gene_type:complete
MGRKKVKKLIKFVNLRIANSKEHLGEQPVGYGSSDYWVGKKIMGQWIRDEIESIWGF